MQEAIILLPKELYGLCNKPSVTVRPHGRTARLLFTLHIAFWLAMCYNL